MREHDLFDEAGYLRLYPGIAEAVATGVESSAWHHFDKHGRREGRRPNDVDVDFYLSAYPQAAEDIAAGRAVNAATHYILFGRGRGYLPNADAPQPVQAPVPSPLGWLWTDLPNALDVVEGRLALGRLKQRQATMLRDWITDGCVTLHRPIERDVVQAAALDLERGFAGAFQELLFDCEAEAPEPVPWRPEINPHPAAAMDPHMFSGSLRDLIFAKPIIDFLGLLFDAPTLCARTRGTLRDAPPSAQQGFPGVAFSLAHQFVVAWIALEDTAEEAALLHYFGSHRFPGLRQAALPQLANDMGLECARWRGSAGQVVIRHADLVHGASSLPELGTRRGLLAHYCPRHIAPRYAVAPPLRVWPYHAHGFVTGVYPGMEPTQSLLHNIDPPDSSQGAA